MVLDLLEDDQFVIGVYVPFVQFPRDAVHVPVLRYRVPRPMLRHGKRREVSVVVPSANRARLAVMGGIGIGGTFPMPMIARGVPAHSELLPSKGSSSDMPIECSHSLSSAVRLSSASWTGAGSARGGVISPFP